MSKPATGLPTGVRALDARIRQARGSQPFEQVQLTVANTVLAQMLPDCAVKGGSAMKFRLGDEQARASQDIDVARRGALDQFVDDLAANLTTGWHGFTGTIRESRNRSKPEGVPDDYVMRAYDVQMQYQGGVWRKLILEVGHDEIGDTGDTGAYINPRLINLFATLGLPEPAPVTVLAIHHQVAQKLHACTGDGKLDRAHDLVDLQLLDRQRGIDLPASKIAAERLFRARNRQAWPPTVDVQPGWGSAYDEAAIDMGVVATVGEAVVWVNELIGKINNG